MCIIAIKPKNKPIFDDETIESCKDAGIILL